MDRTWDLRLFGCWLLLAVVGGLLGGSVLGIRCDVVDTVKALCLQCRCGNGCHVVNLVLIIMTTTSTNKQGPMRLVDLMDRLATEDAVTRDAAMRWGAHETDAYYRAWQWCASVALNNPRPDLPWNARQAMDRIQQRPRDLFGFVQYN